MNCHIIESQSRIISSTSTPPSAANGTKPADAPWWQLYSILIITIGAGIVMAINDPALLHNPMVLLAGILAFFNFVMMWCSKHTREIEAEDWQPVWVRRKCSMSHSQRSRKKATPFATMRPAQVF